MIMAHLLHVFVWIRMELHMLQRTLIVVRRESIEIFIKTISIIYIESTVTLTTRPTTTTTLGPSTNCLNGGVYVDGICNCPSGYSGPLCGEKNGKYLHSFLSITLNPCPFFSQMWIYVRESSVKIVEYAVFEIPMDHTKVFVSVDMVLSANIVNWMVKIFLLD